MHNLYISQHIYANLKIAYFMLNMHKIHYRCSAKISIFIYFAHQVFEQNMHFLIKSELSLKK